MTAPKRIVLEDTGERRYPKGNEVYVVLFEHLSATGEDDLPLEARIATCSGYDDGAPADFAIYRIAEVTTPSVAEENLTHE